MKILNSKSVESAFRSAQSMLTAYGLRAYDPFAGDAKAELGTLDGGLDFLGCRINRGSIRPGDKTVHSLINTIQDLFSDSAATFASPMETARQKKTYLDTMNQVGNVLRGWGNQYSYCNHRQFFNSIDNRIADLERAYTLKFELASKHCSPRDKRRLLGLHVLEDSKYDPIIKPFEGKVLLQSPGHQDQPHLKS